MNKEKYNINGKDIEMDYTFLIHDEKRYKNIGDFLNNQEGLVRLNKRDDLQIYSFKDKEAFLVLDDRNDIDVEVSFTKNISKKVKKNLSKLLK